MTKELMIGKSNKKYFFFVIMLKQSKKNFRISKQNLLDLNNTFKNNNTEILTGYFWTSCLLTLNHFNDSRPYITIFYNIL